MRDPTPIAGQLKKNFRLSVATDQLSSKLVNLKIKDTSIEDLQEEQKEIMSEILPFLYLGSENIPLHSPLALKKQGITHVLNMAQELVDASPSRISDEVCFSTFPMEDVPDSDVVPTLRRVADYIALEENSDSKFLVHCKAGKSRSASAVIAYLILKKKMTYAEAFEVVKTARPSIDPNIGFIVVLSGLKAI